DFHVTGVQTCALPIFPISGEINFEVNDNRTVLGQVSEYYSDQGGQLEAIDGISFSFSDWRFNLRQSNTQPLIRLNMEARNEKVRSEERRVGKECRSRW